MDEEDPFTHRVKCADKVEVKRMFSTYLRRVRSTSSEVVYMAVWLNDDGTIRREEYEDGYKNLPQPDFGNPDAIIEVERDPFISYSWLRVHARDQLESGIAYARTMY